MDNMDYNCIVGFTCSTFDLFHAGHVIMLQEAKANCDYLIAGLQTDPTIDRPQTKNKPVQSLFERFVQLKGCKYVDEIVVYETEAELLNILKSYRINIRFLGEEYKDKEYTGKGLPDIDVYYNSRQHTFSTTELRQRVLDANSKAVK